MVMTEMQIFINTKMGVLEWEKIVIVEKIVVA